MYSSKICKITYCKDYLSRLPICIYDVESLFTNIPIHHTLKYILEEIYTHNKLPHICSKLIFKSLLLKLATESTYIFQSQFYKQTDGCTVGGPLLVTFSNIYLTKLEKDQVKPLKPKFYCRFVDDVTSRRLKNTYDSLFEKLNNYHEKINFTIETNPKKFLDTQLLLENDIIKTEVYRKVNKFPVHWKSQIPKRYKRNAINGDLYRSWRISSNFNHEKKQIRRKFSSVVYPMRFVNSVINDFESNEYGPMISNYLFNDFESKPIVLIDIPFLKENERISKQLLKKFKVFTKEKYDFRIVWKTKKVRQLFPLKEKKSIPFM